MSLDSSAETPRITLAQLSQRWGLTALVCFLLVALWIFILVVMSAGKERLLSANGRELAGLNHAISQQVTALLRQTESNLHTIDRWLQTNSDSDPRFDLRLAALAEDLRRVSAGLIQMRMASIDGKAYLIPTLDGKPAADVKDRAWFTVPLGKSERELYIGDPLVSRVSKKWALPISWRLAAPISGMTLVYASIDLERLLTLHELLRPKPNGAITLVRLDGTVLLRTPFDQRIVGKNLSALSTFKTEYGVNPRGMFTSDSTLTDHIKRQVSYQRLDDYPVTVLVTEAVDDILEPFYKARSVAFSVAGLLTGIALVITSFLQRSIQTVHSVQEELRRHASTDSLTGVMNRRMFNEMAQREFARAQRYNRPATILMLDIDHFKKINDLYGHATGDTVLQECAKVWHALLRPQDIFARVGGEEFCVLLAETSEENARPVAERMREAVKKLQLRAVSDQLTISVSIGLSCIAHSDEQVSQIVGRADRALYRAKETGRDKIVSLDEAPHVSDPLSTVES